MPTGFPANFSNYPPGCSGPPEPTAIDLACEAIEAHPALKAAADAMNAEKGDFRVVDHELSVTPYLAKFFGGLEPRPRLRLSLTVEYDSLDDDAGDAIRGLMMRLGQFQERVERRSELPDCVAAAQSRIASDSNRVLDLLNNKGT